MGVELLLISYKMSPGEQGIGAGENGTQRKKSNGVESTNSHLLTREENAVAFRLLGPRCQSLATAVVQIYQSEPQSNHNRWNKRSCGVVCFVKDNTRRYESNNWPDSNMNFL